MARRNRRTNGRRFGRPLASAASGTALAGLVVGIAWMLTTFVVGAPARDRQGCLVEPPATTVVALDGTTPFSAKQWDEAWQLIASEFDRLRADERLQVYRLDPTTTIRPKLLMEGCAPKAASEGELTGPTETYRRQQAERTGRRLEEAFAGLEQPAGRGRVALVRALAGLVDSRAIRDLRRTGDMRLVLFSDLLDAPGTSRAAREVDLAGLEVRLVLAERIDALDRQDDALERRWIDLVEERGAIVETGGWTVVASGLERPRDARGCLLRPDELNIFMLDATDPFADNQWRRVPELILDVARHMAPDAVLELHVMGEDTPLITPTPELVLCAPSTTVDSPEWASFLQYARIEIDAALTVPPKATRSPIMENLAAIFRHRTRPANTRLHLFSDLLFNSPSGIGFWENGKLAFAQVAEREGVKRSLVDLSGVEARIYYAMRGTSSWKAMQSPLHREMAMDWLKSQGASLELADLVVVEEG